MSYTTKYSKKRKPYHRNLTKINEETINLEYQILSPQKQEKKLLNQITAIDGILKNNNNKKNNVYRLHQGYIITEHTEQSSEEYNQRIVNSIFGCLRKESTIVERGFKIFKKSNHPESVHPSNKSEQKSANRSVKYNENPQKNKIKVLTKPKRWVKYISANPESQQSKSKQTDKFYLGKPHRIITQNSALENSRDTFLVRMAKKLENISKPTLVNYKKKLLIEKKQSQASDFGISTKQQIRSLIQRSHRIFGIWIPPITYPQFNGMFTYYLKQYKHKISPTKSQQLITQFSNIKKSNIYAPKKCRILKYFFYNHFLCERLFEAIIQWVSRVQGQYVEALQLITDRQTFETIFEEYGWKMKCWQSIDKLRIQYQRIKN